MKNLLLVTQGFPYGETERGFLPTEYETLSRHFHLTVLSFGTTDPLLYHVLEVILPDNHILRFPVLQLLNCRLVYQA